MFRTKSAPDEMVAYGGVLYGMRVIPGARPRLEISARDAQGRTRATIVRGGPIAEYYHYFSVGPRGLYASTSVIRRFTDIPDEVLRIDPVTLRVTTRVEGRPATSVLATPQAVYQQLSPSTISRLDPVTLAVRATVDGLPAGGAAEPRFSYGATFGDGALWLIDGDAHGGRILHFAPMTLARLPGAWLMPPGQGGDLVGTPDGVWRLRQNAVTRLMARRGGSVETAVSPFPSAVPDGEGLLVLGQWPSTLSVVRVDGTVTVIPYSGLEEDCRQLTSDGQFAWMRCGADELVRFPLP